MGKKPKAYEITEQIEHIKTIKGKSPETPAGTSIIAFANFKGGVGKTACAVNVAGCLAYNFHKRVLLIDLDVQSSLGQWLMGPESWHTWSQHREQTSYQIFREVMNGMPKWTIHNATFQLPACPNLYVSPATFEMLALDMQLHNQLTKPVHPKPFQCVDIIVKPICGQFDYVIFDCPPNLFHTTQNALFCADFVIIPTVPDFLSTAGLKRLVGFLRDFREGVRHLDPKPVQIAGFIFNMFDKKKNLMQDTIDELDGYLKENADSTNDVFLKNARIFCPSIRNLNDIAKAEERWLPVNIAFPTADVSKDFIQLTREIMEVLDGSGRRTLGFA